MLLLLGLALHGAVQRGNTDNASFWSRLGKTVTLQAQVPAGDSTGMTGLTGATGLPGAKGAEGTAGTNGSNGSNGTDGQQGTTGEQGPQGDQGIPGSNDCIDGICVSRQATTPGVQETGNINIDGTIIAANLQGSGSGVTDVDAISLQGHAASYFTDAGNISTGTLSDGRLSSNVALYDRATSNFTGTLQHNGSAVCDATNNCSYAPASGSGNYIQNQTGSPQTAGFNITGAGTVGGVLSAKAGGKTAITIADSGAQTSGLTIGGDTNLYRSAAGTLKTDGVFRSGDSVVAKDGASQQVTVGYVGAGFAGIALGAAGDTNLYRKSAGLLRTDNSFYIGNDLSGTTVARFTVKTTSPVIAQLIQAGPSQSVDLFQLQDGSVSANVLSGFDSGGQLYLGRASGLTGTAKFFNASGSGSITLTGANPSSSTYTLTLPAENGTLCSTGSVCTGYAPSSGSGNYIQNGTSVQSGNFFIQSAAAGSIGAIIQGAASQTADLLEFQNSSGSKLAIVNQSGDIKTSAKLSVGVPTTTSLAGITSLLAASGSGNIAVVVQGAASQSADLQQWQSSGGAVLSSVNSSGYFGGQRFGAISSGKAFLTTADYSTSDTNAIMINAAGTGANKGLVVRGAASQSANLQEWQDSSGVVLASVSQTGNIDVSSNAATRVNIGAASGNASIRFGSALDTNLYRSAANVLRTDGALKVGAATTDIATITGNGILQSLRASSSSSAIQLFVGANAQPSFTAQAGGVLQWSDGTAAADTNLYRSAADTLKTDDSLSVVGTLSVGSAGSNLTTISGTSGNITVVRTSAASNAFQAQQLSDANLRVQIQANGQINWGDGTNAVDTNLYRSAANILMTDDTFRVGNASDTVYLNSTGYLDSYRAAGTSTSLAARVVGDANQRIVIRADGRLQWGDGTAAVDTNLYRSAANVLQTDSRFLLSGASTGSIALSVRTSADTLDRFNSTAGGVLQWGSGSAALDTNLYRESAGVLASQGILKSITSISTANAFLAQVSGEGTSRFAIRGDGRMEWGGGGTRDTYLSRSGAGALLVQGTGNSATAFQVQNSTNTPAFIVSTNNVAGGYSPTDATLKVGMDSVTSKSINAAGSINASGADYAEHIPWSGPKPAQGSIVTYQGSVYIVSDPTTAAFVGNDNFSDDSILVTFAGQVPVRVTGAVAVGDLLVDNGDGTARAVSPSVASVGDYLGKLGIAQEASADAGVKLVRAAVGTTSSSVAGALQQSGSSSFADLNVSGTATIQNLTVVGSATVGSLRVTGDARFDGPTVSFSSNVRGLNLAVPAGATSVPVVFNTPHPDADYAVQCTPSFDTTCYITGKTATGFTIRFGTPPAAAGKTVDWFVVR